MAKMIKVQLDLAKIDKNRIKYNGKYKNYDIILLETPGSKRGDWLVKEDRTKDERDARVPDTLLGNGKNIGWGDSRPQQQDTNVSSSDLPY